MERWNFMLWRYSLELFSRYFELRSCCTKLLKASIRTNIEPHSRRLIAACSGPRVRMCRQPAPFCDSNRCPNRPLAGRRRHARKASSSYRRDVPARHELERHLSHMHPSPSTDRGYILVRDLAPENIPNSSDSASEYRSAMPSRSRDRYRAIFPATVYSSSEIRS